MFEAIEQRVAPCDATDEELLTAVREHVLWLMSAILFALGRGCPHRAEDFTHDVLAKLLNPATLRNYDPRKGSLRLWLMGLIRWTAIEGLRRDRKSMCDPGKLLLALPDPAPIPDQLAEQVELLELSRCWVSELTANRRAAVERKYLAETAAGGEPESPRVYVHRSRGMADLRKKARALR